MDGRNYRPGIRVGHRSICTPLHFHGPYIRAFNGDMDPYAPIAITLCAGLRCNCENHEAPNMVAGWFNLFRFINICIVELPLDDGVGLHSLSCVMDPSAGRIAPQTDGLEILP